MNIKVGRTQLEELNEFRRNAPEVLDLQSAAVFLGTTERGLKFNAKSLGIPFKKIGTTWIFSKSRVLEWLNEERDFELFDDDDVDNLD